jgi:hypothetical protein
MQRICSVYCSIHLYNLFVSQGAIMNPPPTWPPLLRAYGHYINLIHLDERYEFDYIYKTNATRDSAMLERADACFTAKKACKASLSYLLMLEEEDVVMRWFVGPLSRELEEVND